MSPGMAWVLGLVCLAVGLTPILQVAGVFPIAPDSSSWTMVCVGVLFLAGGLAVIAGYGVPARGGSQWLRIVQYLLSLVITGTFAATTAGVAFGPGERRFGVNLPFLPQETVAVLGRAAFGLAALLLTAMFALFLIGGAVILRRGDRFDQAE
jgi:hypothetical protein